MNLRQAAQQALEALEQFRDISDFTPASAVHAITALRAALAEPEQEPVAWWNGRETVWLEHELMGTNPPIENPIPLYTAPTPRKPLTDEEIAEVYLEWDAAPGRSMADFARDIEAAHGIGDNNGS